MDIGVDKIEDLLSDEEFRDWVLNPTPDSEAFWAEWMEFNPDKKKMLLTAKDIIYVLGCRNIVETIACEEKARFLDKILNYKMGDQNLNQKNDTNTES